MEERQEWPLPTLLAPEPLLVNTCQPTVQRSPEGLAALGGLGSVSASAGPSLPAPQEPVPSLEKGFIVLSCAPP